MSSEQSMSNHTISIELDKKSINTILNILDKYQERHVFQSNGDRDHFYDLYRKLKIALFELTFLDY